MIIALVLGTRPPQMARRNQAVILSALLAFLLRQVGRVVNVSFGWTTTVLLGKVPKSKSARLTGRRARDRGLARDGAA